MGRKTTKSNPQSTKQKTLSYKEMVRQAILGLKDKQGSSKKEILNYITANFNVDKDAGEKVEAELRQGVKNGTVVQFKGKSRTRLFRPENSKKKSTEKSAEKNVKEDSKKTITKKRRFEDEIMTKAKPSVKAKESKEKRKTEAIATTKAAEKNKTVRRKKKRKSSKTLTSDAAPKKRLLSYKEMVRQAILGLKDKQGSSKKEILNYITANFNVDKDAGKKIEAELRQGVKNGTVVQFKGRSRTRLFRPENSKKKSTEKSAEKNVKEDSKKTITKKRRFEDEIMTKAKLSVKAKEAKEERKPVAIATTKDAKKNKTVRRKKKRKCSKTPTPDAAPKKLSDREIDAKIFAFFDEIWQNM